MAQKEILLRKSDFAREFGCDDMIATVPRRMALLEAPKMVTVLAASAALGSFKYVMI